MREARVAAHILGLKAQRRLPRARPSSRRTSRTSRARPIRSRRRELASKKLVGLPLLRRGAAHVSAALGRGAGARLRGHRQHRASPGSSSQLNSELTGRAGEQTSSSDPFGRAIKIAHTVAGAAGQGGVPHARPHDPGERGAGAARDGRAVGREARDGDRARPEDGRHPRDGRGADLRRERVSRRRRRCRRTMRSPTSSSRARCSRS